MTDSTVASLAADQTCAITHLCCFLAKHGYRLSDPSNYTESLPVPSADPAEVLNAVAATGEAHLWVIDDTGRKCGWVYLILPPAVSRGESVADHTANFLLESWAVKYYRNYFPGC